ncbi:hypothetical protein ACOME3_006537 [Neoechinorhynchus agilis]
MKKSAVSEKETMDTNRTRERSPSTTNSTTDNPAKSDNPIDQHNEWNPLLTSCMKSLKSQSFSKFSDYRFLPTRNTSVSISWTDQSKDDIGIASWTGMCRAIKTPYIPPSMKTKYINNQKRKSQTQGEQPIHQPVKLTRMIDPSMLLPYFNNHNRHASPTLDDVTPVSPTRTVGVTRDPVPANVNTYETVLGNELLGSEVEVKENLSPNTGILQNPESVYNSSHQSILDYSSPLTQPKPDKREQWMEFRKELEGTGDFGITQTSRSLMNSTSDLHRSRRTVQKTPYKVLDAPDLMDDFYLSLVDWSKDNLLAVGLKQRVYLWNAATSAVTKLEELVSDAVTSLSWSQYQCGGDAKYLAVGTRAGSLQIWDVQAKKRVTQYDDPNRTSNSSRVGVIAWNQWLVCSGSRDRHITIYDFRCRDYCMDVPSVSRSRRCRLKGSYVDLTGHVQEVCGLKWSPDHDMLASGGNDNKVLIRSLRNLKDPLHFLIGHSAAVKAMDWSPHKHALLATGGGTADRTIRFWNCLTGHMVHTVDTGSQVCNIAWSEHSNEFVSTHGYSQNEIILWKYPTLRQTTRFNGHSFRVLYLAKSPDGRSIVTGAGDETLRFWRIFGGVRDNLSNMSGGQPDPILNDRSVLFDEGAANTYRVQHPEYGQSDSLITSAALRTRIGIRDALHQEGFIPSR